MEIKKKTYTPAPLRKVDMIGNDAFCKHDIREKARKLADKHAWGKLIELMNCGSPRVELAACQEILNRAYGKPRSEDSDSDKNSPINISIGWEAQVLKDVPPKVQIEKKKEELLALGTEEQSDDEELNSDI